MAAVKKPYKDVTLRGCCFRHCYKIIVSKIHNTVIAQLLDFKLKSGTLYNILYSFQLLFFY